MSWHKKIKITNISGITFNISISHIQQAYTYNEKKLYIKKTHINIHISADLPKHQ